MIFKLFSNRYGLVWKGQLHWTQSQQLCPTSIKTRGYSAHVKNINNSCTSNASLIGGSCKERFIQKELLSWVPNENLKCNIVNATHHINEEFSLCYRVHKYSFVLQTSGSVLHIFIYKRKKILTTVLHEHHNLVRETCKSINDLI